MSRSSRTRPDADPAYAGLKARIVARTGHHYYADKDDLLLDRLHRRFRAAGVPGCAAYAALLSDPAAGEAEWQRLEAEITVGETFFFRYAEQFAALRDTILPGLVAARGPERNLRIWSAGCSTGAEPYSLAILVREILGGALPDWRVTILGTDISAEALATARAAEYGRWALRTTPPEERRRYFTRSAPRPGAQRDGSYTLRPEYRELVTFERGNLLRLAEPAGAAREGPPPLPYDLILCRNVLIYFDAETVAAVVRGLGRRLRPDGWLLLGHAEPNPAFSGFLDPLSLPGTVAYRPKGSGQAAPAAEPPSSAREPTPPPVADLRAAFPPPFAGEGTLRSRGGEGSHAAGGTAPLDPAPSLPSPDPLRRPPSPAEGGGSAQPVSDASSGSPEAAEDALARVRALADSGETAAAWRAVRDGLAARPTDARLRYYEGLLAGTLGREAEAERALRAALYLDRGFVMAHYHLGLLLTAQGRTAEGRRALDNAAALSQALPPDAPLPEGDGARAGDVAGGVARGARDGVRG